MPIRTTFGGQMVQTTLIDLLSPALPALSPPQGEQREPSTVLVEDETFRRFQEFIKWRRLEQGFTASQPCLDDLPPEFRRMVPVWALEGRVELLTYGSKKSQSKTYVRLCHETSEFTKDELPEIMSRFRAACERVPH